MEYLRIEKLKKILGVSIMTILLCFSGNLSFSQNQQQYLKLLLQPAIELAESFNNFRCVYVERRTFFGMNDTFEYFWNVNIKKLRKGAFYLKKESDQVIVLKDSTGSYLYKKQLHFLYSNTEIDVVNEIYPLAFPEKIEEIVSDSLLSLDSLSQPDYYIIQTERNTDSSDIKNLIFKIWLNKQTKRIDKFQRKATLENLSSYILYTVYDFQTNLQNIEDSLRVDIQNLPIKKYIDTKANQKADTIGSTLLHQKSPAFKLRTIQGDSIDLYSMKGKVILLDFFYRGCYPCMLMHNKLIELREKFPESELQIIGIDPLDKELKVLLDYSEYKGINYPIALCDKELANAYKVSAFPSVFIIDKTFTIRNVYKGFTEENVEGIENSILQLSKE